MGDRGRSRLAAHDAVRFEVASFSAANLVAAGVAAAGAALAVALLPSHALGRRVKTVDAPNQPEPAPAPAD